MCCTYVTYSWLQGRLSRRGPCCGCQHRSAHQVAEGRSAADRHMPHPLFLPLLPHRNCCWENPSSGKRQKDIIWLCSCGNGFYTLALSQKLSICSAFQHNSHDCVKHYLHSDSPFFGHSLVHPNEGHIVVKVIDRALKRDMEKKMEWERWSIERLTARGKRWTALHRTS